jgi:peptidoglycan hydrolase-like protein with peptidoglycan-binding domain
MRLPRLFLSLLVAGLGALPWGGALAQTVPGKSASSKTSKKPTVTKKKKPAPRRTRGQAAPTTERIREIQAALVRTGQYSGEPTGKWDAATSAALSNFQQSKGLKPTGKLDAQTLQQLGLGSPVSGVAPPRPTSAPAGTPNRSQAPA